MITDEMVKEAVERELKPLKEAEKKLVTAMNTIIQGLKVLRESYGGYKK